jgi:hypothetical protein
MEDPGDLEPVGQQLVANRVNEKRRVVDVDLDHGPRRFPVACGWIEHPDGNRLRSLLDEFIETDDLVKQVVCRRRRVSRQAAKVALRETGDQLAASSATFLDQLQDGIDHRGSVPQREGILDRQITTQRTDN